MAAGQAPEKWGLADDPDKGVFGGQADLDGHEKADRAGTRALLWKLDTRRVGTRPLN